MSAISSRHPVEVETILKSGVNPDIYPNTIEDCREEIDITPLNSAAEDGSTEIVRMLLDHGADPNKGDGWHVGGPLSAATRKDSLATMALLLKRGASLNEYGGTGAAIWRAAMDGKVRSVRFLLDHGATTTPEFLKLLRETQGSPEIISMIEKWLERHP
jgi:ankyrin repeat protein